MRKDIVIVGVKTKEEADKTVLEVDDQYVRSPQILQIFQSQFGLI